VGFKTRSRDTALFVGEQAINQIAAEEEEEEEEEFFCIFACGD
jgi:hypothetical protein